MMLKLRESKLLALKVNAFEGKDMQPIFTCKWKTSHASTSMRAQYSPSYSPS